MRRSARLSRWRNEQGGIVATAFIFPGQGSQSVGMGEALASAEETAREVFQEVDGVLGQDLSRLMFTGPEDELTLTANAQPAIMAVSVAVARMLERRAGRPIASLGQYVAGHSLGEYSALCATGSLSLGDTARLLRTRGDAMQAAVAPGTGAMAALLGLDADAAVEIAAQAAQGEACEVANDNAPGQVVVSGHKAAVERAVALAKERGARRAVMLAVSAPFHCALMAPAADVMNGALGKVPIASPALPVYANVTASPVISPDEIRSLLVEQVTSRVRWRESIANMAAAGVDRFVELGGKVVAPMVKRIAPEATAVSLLTADDIDAWLGSL
jgi:[acyl-carrier-protein] S-malonyltransferase